jgi:23S rRNA pseudouridine1911/1915/1917 synthase
MTPGHAYPPVAIATTLLPWLIAAHPDSSRTRVKELLQSGRVHVNNCPVTLHSHTLHVGDRITILRAAAVAKSTLELVYEDNAIVVINKPSGLLTVATDAEKEDTAFVRLAAQLPARPFVVHRIDRGTSGLLLFARSQAIRDELQAGWDTVEKTYLAIVEGSPRTQTGRIENHLIEGKNLRMQARMQACDGSQLAVSEYRVLAQQSGFSLVEVRIETGRKHQIRVHLSGLGCPIIGDRDYGATTNPARRLGLHATRLAFMHPVLKSRLELHSPLPVELERIV